MDSYGGFRDDLRHLLDDIVKRLGDGEGHFLAAHGECMNAPFGCPVPRANPVEESLHDVVLLALFEIIMVAN